MPRWLQIALTLLLYAAGMAVVLWLLNLAIPPLQVWLFEKIGGGWAMVLLGAVGIVSALFAYWPRRPDGSMRRLRSPWD